MTTANRPATLSALSPANREQLISDAVDAISLLVVTTPRAAKAGSVWEFRAISDNPSDPYGADEISCRIFDDGYADKMPAYVTAQLREDIRSAVTN